MSRLRIGVGLATAVLLLLSSAAHSIAGGRQVAAELAAAQVPPDLALGLQVGWQFGGAAMLVFGLIALEAFVGRWRGRAVSLRPGRFIGAIYLLFAAWALVRSNFDPFFLVFAVPGALLLAVAWPRADDDAPPTG